MGNNLTDKPSGTVCAVCKQPEFHLNHFAFVGNVPISGGHSFEPALAEQPLSSASGMPPTINLSPVAASPAEGPRPLSEIRERYESSMSQTAFTDAICAAYDLGRAVAAQPSPDAAPSLADWQHWEEINTAGIYDRYLAKRDALRVKSHRPLAASAAPAGAAPPDEDDIPKYPCADCGVLRSKNGGGTTFTVCDECWNKAYAPASEIKLAADDISQMLSTLESQVQNHDCQAALKTHMEIFGAYQRAVGEVAELRAKLETSRLNADLWKAKKEAAEAQLKAAREALQHLSDCLAMIDTPDGKESMSVGEFARAALGTQSLGDGEKA